MNGTWVRSLQLHHKRAYYGQPTVDMGELSRAMKMLSGASKLVEHAVTSKSEVVGEDE
jgi:hypothetical protein